MWADAVIRGELHELLEELHSESEIYFSGKIKSHRFPKNVNAGGGQSDKNVLEIAIWI